MGRLINLKKEKPPQYLNLKELKLDLKELLDDTDKEKELYENTEKLKKIEKGYKWLLQEFPKEFTIIDAERTKKEVHKEIMKLL